MTGQLVKCKWLEESICIVVDVEERRLSGRESYYICRVVDFITQDIYWVDEEDLEKL